MKQIEIFESSLLSKMYSWKMPKSDLFYPIVELGENCIGNKFNKRDKLKFELFFKEMYENFVLSNKLILDVSEVKYQSSILNLLLEIENNYLDAIFIVGTSDRIESREHRIVSFVSREKAILEILDIDRKKRFDGGSNFDVASAHGQITVLPYNFPTPRSIEISMFLGIELGRSVGYVKIKGDLELGSIDSDDIKIVNRKINQFDKLYSTDFLILDFSELSYFWGDNFNVYPNRFRYVNLAEKEYRSLFLVIKEDQILDGYSSVLNENEDRIFPTFEIAMNEIRVRIQSGMTNS